MKKYIITVEQKSYAHITVEADNINEAKWRAVREAEDTPELFDNSVKSYKALRQV